MKIAIKAEPRSVQGTGASRRLRRESKVPGVLYGAGKDALPIEVDHKELWFKLKTEAFHASILDLSVGDEKSQHTDGTIASTPPHHRFALQGFAIWIGTNFDQL